MTTPEEFLAQQTALRDLAAAMSPLYQIVATVRLGFIEEAGLGETAADELTVTWFRDYALPALRGRHPKRRLKWKLCS